MGIVSLLLFFSTLVAVVAYLYKSSKLRPKNFPPGPYRLPIWGSYWIMLKENYLFSHLSLDSLSKQYKTDILGLYLGNTPTVVTFSYEASKEMLTRDEFTGRNDTIVSRTRALGDMKGIFFMDGPFWKAQRRLSLRQMRDFGFGRRSNVVEDAVADEVQYLIKILENEPDDHHKDVCKGKGIVLLPDLLYGPLLNRILEIMGSKNCDYYEMREMGRTALRFQRSGDATGCALVITPWLRHLAPDFFGYTPVVEDNGIMYNFLKGIVNEHLDTFSDDHHRDFIDVFISENCKDDNTLDVHHVVMTLLDYMLPAAIAIGHTLSFYFVYIINNPQIQRKIHEEIDKVVGRSRFPNLNDRNLMPYLEATIKETIRIVPINPLGVARRCMEDTYLRGYFIPKDTIMIASAWSANRDETIWTEPEEFLPERYLDAEGNLLKKDYNMAFGGGKRVCAGETYSKHLIFQIASGLLQNFTFSSIDGKPIPFDVVPGANLSMRENWVKATPR